ncbi:MAG: thiolase family protein, partial [Chloroflexota bacterium]|nr:thiolase family protein [Chloroflexota bacterium]
MRFEKAFIPLGLCWSSPFARWQGPLSEVSSMDLAVAVTRKALEERSFDPAEAERFIYGWTIPQETSFFGAPTVAARIGAPGISGPMISQACATSAVAVHTAAAGIEAGDEGVTLVVVADRTSNGPYLLYPNPSAMGGAPAVEHWVLDNFRRDPWAGEAMVDTAENVAKEAGITRQEADEVTLLRYEQYRRGLVDDRAFQRHYMVPAVIPQRKGEPLALEADSGIIPSTAEGLARLKPVSPDGVTTYGSQTHPADGAAGALVADRETARRLGQDGQAVQLLATGFARVEKARMPKAPVPAALSALRDAGLTMKDVDAVTT